MRIFVLYSFLERSRGYYYSMEKCLKPPHEEKRKISAIKLKHVQEICNELLAHIYFIGFT